MSRRIEPGAGQESVWDYPRPPRLEPCERAIEIWFGGRRIAASGRSYRVLETSHPPVYYLPPDDVEAGCLRPTGRASFCEFKGRAVYFDVVVEGRTAPSAAWSYPDPTPPFAALRDHLAFYPAPMDRCTVDGEAVRPQPGGFYGGWITADVVGPFKVGPGSAGW